MNCLINPVDTLTRIEYHGLPVLTTEQLAKALSSPDKTVTVQNLSYNFKYNQARYIEGKHYFKVEGEELEILRTSFSGLQISPKTRSLYLWTKRGCARHCKSVNTDTAWDVFEVLEDTYFNVEKILKDKPLPSISNYKLAIAATKLAAHAEDPYEKRKLVVKAANLLFGEEFLPEPSKATVQLSLFK